MKIGIVCYPTFGGSGVVATELGKALADIGNQVHFITYNQPVRLDFFSQNLFYHEVNVSQYPLFDYPPYELALASKLVDVVRFEKLDLLHVHYAIPHASAAFMAKQILGTYGINIPVVTTLHGTDITIVGKDATYKPVVTFSINQSDGVTSVSQHLKDDTYKHFDVKKDIRVIPNFVDFNRFKNHSKDHFKKAIAPDNQRILVHTSNFRKVKRTKDVIQIFHQVLNEIPAKLLMVGDGPERVSAEKMCRDLQICDHVRFLGKQEAVEEILSIADLFIMPSETESFGLAALEAMACKVPTITSDAGGLPELVQNRYSGFTSPVGAVDEMAQNAIKILKFETVLQEFKNNSYQRALEFSLDSVLPKYVDYYKEVIEKSKL